MRRHDKIRTLVALAAVIATAAVAHAATSSSGNTYYVSADGSDSNPGTQTAPWKTVGRVNHASLAPGDQVLFRGGDQFTDATLTPPSSGSSSSPILFGSYGTGRPTFNSGVDVWLQPASHDYIFDNLDFTGSGILFASAASGTGVFNVKIQNSSFHDTPQAAINIATHADHDWTITESTFKHIGDSAVFIWGDNVALTDSVISDTGWNPAITWGKHGVYDKGPNSTIANNDFSGNANGQSISLRSHGARVYGNSVHDTPYGLAFFDYDTAAPPQGVDYVYNNRFWNITGYAFYYDGNDPDPQGNPPSVSFVFASNTVVLASAGEAVNVSEVPSAASIILANNVFTGSYGSAYRGCPTCSEFNNDWYGASSNVPNGSGDRRVSPGLAAAPGLAPPSGSPIVDVGTTSVGGVSYSASCDGAPLHYCGTAPDLGAVEFVASPSPPPTTTTTTTAQTTTAAPPTTTAPQPTTTTVTTTTAPTTTATPPTTTTSPPTTTTTTTTAASPQTTTPTSTTTSATHGHNGHKPPRGRFLNVSAGSTIVSGSPVRIAAQDISGSANLALTIDGNSVCAAKTPRLTCVVVASGWHSLAAVATDKLGNSGTTQLRIRFGPKRVSSPTTQSYHGRH